MYYEFLSLPEFYVYKIHSTTSNLETHYNKYNNNMRKLKLIIFILCTLPAAGCELWKIGLASPPSPPPIEEAHRPPCMQPSNKNGLPADPCPASRGTTSEKAN
jgi:hypothetical protein